LCKLLVPDSSEPRTIKPAQFVVEFAASHRAGRLHAFGHLEASEAARQRVDLDLVAPPMYFRSLVKTA
jgi:hypothetical protein